MPLALNCYDLPPAEVEQRFRWARRQGSPAWLWPGVAVEEWRDALRSIEKAVGDILSTGSSDLPLDGDPEALGLACYTSGTGPILGWWHEQGQLVASTATAELLALHLRHNRLRAAKLEAAAIEVTTSLLDRDIDVAVFKGIHTAGAYFPERGTRPASDIDLLVDPGQTAAAEAVLRAAGFIETIRSRYESGWRCASVAPQPRSLMLVHADDPWSVDLHNALDLVFCPGVPRASLSLGNPMDSRRSWHACAGVKTLDQPLLLLHLAVHASAGLQSLTLLRLIELHLVIRQDEASGLLSWNSFLDLAGRTGSRGFAYPALRLCEELAPGTVPQSVLDQCARHVPDGALRVLSALTPATAQRVARSSLAEHFMWAGSWRARLRQVASDIAVTGSWKSLWPVYERRAWQLLRGRISR